MADLRNNEDDRPYRGVSRTNYVAPGQREDEYDDTMTTQAYYRERLRGVTEQRWFPLAAVTLGVVIFGSLIAFAYHQGADTTANSTTPLIQAENGSYKEKPQNPGGMDVPFQDAVVFDQIDQTKTASAGAPVENLLPPPEQPVETKTAAATTTQTPAATTTTQRVIETAPPSAPKEDAAKGTIASSEDTDSVADKIAATEASVKAKTETAAPATVATSTSSTTTETATASPVTSTPVAAKTTETKTVATSTKTASAKSPSMEDVFKSTTTTTTVNATPAKMNAVAPAAHTPAPAVKTGTGSAKVQLGAFKDQAAAKAAWASLQKQYSPHLNGVTPNYARADLGAKGVFYRVQGVNLSKAQATDICKSINATKPGACILAQ